MFAPLDEQVHNTIAAAPNARFFLRLRLLIPDWWTKAHPDQAILYHDGCRSLKNHWEQRVYPPSLASELWQKDTEALLRQLARDAGVHIYANSSDLIHATSGMVCIHAGSVGQKAIHLPQFCIAQDPFKPEEDPVKTKTLTAQMKKGETKIWILKAS